MGEEGSIRREGLFCFRSMGIEDVSLGIGDLFDKVWLYPHPLIGKNGIGSGHLQGGDFEASQAY